MSEQLAASDRLLSDVDRRIRTLEAFRHNRRNACTVWRGLTTQSVPASSNALVAWDSEITDTDNYFPGVGNTTITIPAGGGVFSVTVFVYDVSAVTLTAQLELSTFGNMLVDGSAVGDLLVPMTIVMPVAGAATFAVRLTNTSAPAQTARAFLYLERAGPL